MGSDSGGRRWQAFRSLAGNRALVRVLAAYALFVLTEYAVWIAMLVFAYSRGGAGVAGLVAVAEMVPAGELDVMHDGHLLRQCGRGEGVGEIALLRDIPRTATVVAHSAATVYELHRDLFLTAVLGHAPTQRQAHLIADARLATGGAAGTGQGPDTPEPG